MTSFINLENEYDNEMWDNAGSNDFSFHFNNALNLKSTSFDIDPSTSENDNKMGAESQNNNDPFINENIMQDDGFSNIIGNLNYPLSSFLSNNYSTTSNHQLPNNFHHLQDSPLIMQDFSSNNNNNLISYNNSVLSYNHNINNNSINNNLTIIDPLNNDSNDNWANFDIADNFADFDAHFSKLSQPACDEPSSNVTVFNVNSFENVENVPPIEPSTETENENPVAALPTPNFAIFPDPQPQATVFPAFDTKFEDVEDEEFYSLRSENSEDISEIKTGEIEEDNKESSLNPFLEDDDDCFASADER